MSNEQSLSTGRIFISYRRDDTAFPAGWLYDRLVERFGFDQVFKDVDSIELGDDFVETITEAVASCDILLALIGKVWLEIGDPDAPGSRRLDDPQDFVRLEIEAALSRDVLLVPILVEGARLPRSEQLPPSIAPVTRRQALELDPSRFRSDTERLLTVIERELESIRQSGRSGEEITSSPLLVEAQGPGKRRLDGKNGPRPEKSKLSARRLGLAWAASLMVVATLVWLFVPQRGPTPDDVAPQGTTPSTTVQSESIEEPSGSSGDLTAKKGTAKLGAELDLGSVKVTAYKYETGIKDPDGFKPDPGMRWDQALVRLCNVKLKSSDEQEAAASYSAFQLRDGDDGIHEELDMAPSPATAPRWIDFKKLAPGDCMKGWVAFDVTERAKPGAITYSIDSEELARWRLQ